MVLQLVEVTHTNLTEVTRVILVHHDSVMVLTTSHTAASRVLAVLTDAAVTGGHVAALFAVLVQLRAGKHRDSTVSTHTLTPSRVSRLETETNAAFSPRARPRAEENLNPSPPRAHHASPPPSRPPSRALIGDETIKNIPHDVFTPLHTLRAFARVHGFLSNRAHWGFSRAIRLSSVHAPTRPAFASARSRVHLGVRARVPASFPLAHRSHRGRARTLVGILRVAERRIERRAVALEAVEATGPDRWTHGRVAVR